MQMTGISSPTPSKSPIMPIQSMTIFSLPEGISTRWPVHGIVAQTVQPITRCLKQVSLTAETKPMQAIVVSSRQSFSMTTMSTTCKSGTIMLQTSTILFLPNMTTQAKSALLIMMPVRSLSTSKGSVLWRIMTIRRLITVSIHFGLMENSTMALIFPRVQASIPMVMVQAQLSVPGVDIPSLPTG